MTFRGSGLFLRSPKNARTVTLAVSNSSPAYLGVSGAICYCVSMAIKTYTREQLTEILQVSLSTVGNLINNGDIFSIRVGKSIRIPEWSLEDYLAGRPAYKPGDPMLEPDYHELPTDSMFTAVDNEAEA
jgi:excisionase family DNA binding protein